MRTLAGAVLIATAEQAFAHSQLVQFPNHLFASEILMPSSGVLLALGVGMLIWGALTDFRQHPQGGKACASGKTESPE